MISARKRNDLAEDSKMLDLEILELFRQLPEDKKDESLRLCEEMVYKNFSGKKG